MHAKVEVAQVHKNNINESQIRELDKQLDERRLGLGTRTAYSFKELSTAPRLTSSLAPTLLPIFPRPESASLRDRNQ